MSTFNGVKSMQSLMINRGNTRIWLQGMAAYGWAAGKAYTVEYLDTCIVIRHTQGAKRQVGKQKEGLIDLCNKQVTRWSQSMGDTVTHVDFECYDDRIEIVPARQHRELAPRVPTPREDATPKPSLPVMPEHTPAPVEDNSWLDVVC